mgnify:CR=1 FL=1
MSCKWFPDLYSFLKFMSCQAILHVVALLIHFNTRKNKPIPMFQPVNSFLHNNEYALPIFCQHDCNLDVEGLCCDSFCLGSYISVTICGIMKQQSWY